MRCTATGRTRRCCPRCVIVYERVDEHKGQHSAKAVYDCMTFLRIPAPPGLPPGIRVTPPYPTPPHPGHMCAPSPSLSPNALMPPCTLLSLATRCTCCFVPLLPPADCALSTQRPDGDWDEYGVAVVQPRKDKDRDRAARREQRVKPSAVVPLESEVSGRRGRAAGRGGR